jgi:hypothetical protein
MPLPQAPMRGPVEASFGCHASQEPFEFRKYVAEKVNLTGDCAYSILPKGPTAGIGKSTWYEGMQSWLSRELFWGIPDA